jgi:hypothetical protein
LKFFFVPKLLSLAGMQMLARILHSKEIFQFQDQATSFPGKFVHNPSTYWLSPVHNPGISTKKSE